ncbi:MAG: hypothetical protein KatS3mg009_3148 [Acidimicrobiia bacterium]|nr:MAG: hypothetical protein KatS3mg009_3148 [Acidimicrobiia bacterium]
MTGNVCRSVDEYVASHPENVRRVLREVRHTKQKAAPEAVGTVGHGFPTLDHRGGRLVRSAAFEGHVGFGAPFGLHAR